jgi:hypothetical protein
MSCRGPILHTWVFLREETCFWYPSEHKTEKKKKNNFGGKRLVAVLMIGPPTVWAVVYVESQWRSTHV